ncbi:RhuM family protein [uncultured Fibrobacter sp.]|uniref:RhuM family protein n=1 Tax=uncultured Fibrobacter sp. TaxID=261512 RepID=UPI0025DAB0DB|nr:RhuM family protein [uncultured Fibrobacter sp.]
MNKKGKTALNVTLEEAAVGEVVMYQAEGSIQLPVRIENDTVWLTIDQMVLLFGKSRSTINEHILNAISEGEVDKNTTIRKIGKTDFSTKPTNFYNLDVIISVGYRVKSIQGTLFRRWANQVLKDYLLRGFSVNQRFMLAEERIDQQLVGHDKRFQEQESHLNLIESRVGTLEKQVDFFVKANLPPKEGVLQAKAFWSGYEFAVQLVRSAKQEIVIIDPFADDTALSLMPKRNPRVNAIIYSARINQTMKAECDRLNRQCPPVELRTMREVHDRFIVVDETVYHIGASIKDLGNKLTAFSVLGFVTKQQLLEMIK